MIVDTIFAHSENLLLSLDVYKGLEMFFILPSRRSDFETAPRVEREDKHRKKVVQVTRDLKK